ncbi:hypothetical protein C8R46DRAFT_1229281 [Mycena filopes]|nr:hypothetical protein C8R46DRAFT_1229281 [Mycena filopes]
MESMFMLKNGDFPLLSSMRLDEDVPSLSWQGIGGHCSGSIPRNAIELMDDVSYLTNDNEFDGFGRSKILEISTTADWYRHTYPARGFIPIAPEPGCAPEWFQSMDIATPFERTTAGLWRIPNEHCGIMENTIIAFRDALDGVAEHPKYDIFIYNPSALDVEELNQEFPSYQALQVLGAQAKRSILDIWAHLAWWISSVPGWDEGIAQEVVERILGWNLLSRPKRGFLVCLTRDWPEMNFGHLIELGVPLFYVWGTFEDTDDRFLRLSPKLLDGYRAACEAADVRSMWGDEIPSLSRVFARCDDYDAFFEKRLDPRARKISNAPVWTETSGRISYEIKDFASWKRRLVGDEEDWRNLDKLFHHVVVEDATKEITTVVFFRFHRKPLGQELNEEGDFMDEDIAEAPPTEFRERFKGRCAPRLGQTFDLETGVERSRPVNARDAVATTKFEEERFLAPPPASLGRSAIYGRSRDGRSHGDTTKLGRSIGPRSIGPSSNHSSERREGDTSRPMAHTSSWVVSMSRDDHVGMYQRRSRRQRVSPSPSRTSQTQGSSSGQIDRSGSRRRSASPEERGRYPERQKPPPKYVPPWHPIQRVRKTLQRRAEYLTDFRDWATQITSNIVLWRVPGQYDWNLPYLKEGYLIISEASEVRLRLLALMTPGVRFARHVLTLGIEHGIAFQIGLKNPTYLRFAPTTPPQHRAITKAQIESTDRRLEAATSSVTTHARYLRLLGEVASLPNARALIGRGGTASWILRAHGYIGLVDDFMTGPSIHMTVYHGGANDAADDDCIGVRWDEVNDNDYLAVHGVVPGATRETDASMYPTDEVLESISKHYYREWNEVLDKHFQNIKKEWEERPCRGKLRNRGEWITFFYPTNHGRFAPDIEVNASWIEEGRARLTHAFAETSWNKKMIWALPVPEVFKSDF